MVSSKKLKLERGSMMEKRFKRGLSLLSVVIMLISMMPIGVMAEEVTTVNETTFNQITETETVQSSTSDSDFDYIYSRGGVSINGYTGQGGNVVIPDILDGKKVMSIGSNAFAGRNRITSIKIPDSVVDIGDEAFIYCTGLTSIEIPNSVISIGGQAFAGCSGLTSIKISNSVTYMGGWIFMSCTGLKSIVIPDSMTNIAHGAFENCRQLTNIVIPNSITSIDDSAFRSCTSLTNITIPNSVTTIGDYAFYGISNLTFYGVKGSYSETYANEKNIPFLANELTSISVITPPAKTIYEVGENLDLTGMLVTGTYNNGINEPIVVTASNISGFNSSSPAVNQTITVTVSGKTAIFKVNITENKDNEIAKTVIDQINSLPSVNQLKLTDKEAVVEVRTAYDQLTNAQKALVKNLTVLTEAEKKIAELEKAVNPQKPILTYQTHVQNEGWQSYVANGSMSGTEGKSYRLEGIKIKLDAKDYDLGISYQTHIQNIGWEADTLGGWKNNDNMSGTEGLSYRLEAIQIKLTGTDSDKFDIFYRVHAQNFGWLDWAKNGNASGTAGFGYRLEAIEILVLPKDTTAPGKIDKPFIQNN